MGWIKDKIRKWLAEDEDSGPPLPVLEAMLDGKIVRIVPVAAIGTGLICKVPSRDGAMGQRMILEHNAVDRDHFWQLWKHFGGRAVWEDGTEFKPEE